MMQTVAEGWWCNKCEFFESEDDIDLLTDICVACGCEGSHHRPVEIITKGLS